MSKRLTTIALISLSMTTPLLLPMHSSGTSKVGLSPSPAKQSSPQDPRALPRFRDPIRPHLLELGRTFVTICWMTPKELIGELTLHGYADSIKRTESAASRFHKIRIEGLSPGTRYRYEVGRNHVGSFTTASSTRPFELAVFGHPGGTEHPLQYPAELVAARLAEFAPDLVLSTGDITDYATVSEFSSSYFHRFADFLAERPIYVTASNHDGRWSGNDYKNFRKLFPYDFGGDTGAYYAFDYNHARFFAVTYRMTDKKAYAEQMKWLERSLDASEAEFNIVFLGGQDPSYYDKPAFFKLLSKHRVDLVLGGDGGGTFQEENSGVPFFFSGNGAMHSYPFYYLRFYEHHFSVHLARSQGQDRPKPLRFFYSKKPKKVALELAGYLNKSAPYAVHYGGINRLSTEQDGVHLTVNWPYKFDANLRLKWGTKSMKKGVREQYHPIKANQKIDIQIALPVFNRVVNDEETYILDKLQIDMVLKGKKRENFPIQGFITKAYLFKN